MEENKRKGGRYTQEERDRRREAVYRMHFVEKQVANQIAARLGVNRHTVNADIKWLHQRLLERYHADDPNSMISMQMVALEERRDRLAGSLEQCSNMHEKLQVEKLLHKVDLEINGLLSKVKPPKKKTGKAADPLGYGNLGLDDMLRNLRT